MACVFRTEGSWELWFVPLKGFIAAPLDRTKQPWAFRIICSPSGLNCKRCYKYTVNIIVVISMTTMWDIFFLRPGGFFYVHPFLKRSWESLPYRMDAGFDRITSKNLPTRVDFLEILATHVLVFLRFVYSPLHLLRRPFSFQPPEVSQSLQNDITQFWTFVCFPGTVCVGKTPCSFYERITPQQNRMWN